MSLAALVYTWRCAHFTGTPDGPVDSSCGESGEGPGSDDEAAAHTAKSGHVTVTNGRPS